MSSCNYGVRWRAITHARPCQNPYFIFGPTFELVQNERGRVEGNHSRLRIRSIFFHELQFVVDDTTVGPVGRRRTPRYSNCCRTDCFPGNVLRRRSWYLSVNFFFVLFPTYLSVHFHQNCVTHQVSFF